MKDRADWLELIKETLLTPGRVVYETAGLERSDVHVMILYIGIVFALITANSLRRNAILKERGVPATGSVIGLQRDPDGPDRPRIAYKDKYGGEWTFVSDVPCKDETKFIGSEVDILYDPDHPSRAQEAGRQIMRSWQNVMAVTVSTITLVIAFMPLPFTELFTQMG
ncbi:DUF3592 domain-containing protein [Parvularcula marina]|uniref:DUF3592 domain-containing protein n=1 Tax=Parvularcula marina TaxID=2292771 RepID=A0A371RFG3_9PROT|nr:DUF3592 domain-containing protein [Parvularcula marina]RFB04186.1 hypothetical protein DX908_02145 [Parvularcula marina]